MKQEIDFTGLSTFFYFAIPAVLAIAAIWWLAFGEGLHYFRRTLSQEKRHAEIVGAAILPKEPLKIHLTEGRGQVLRIERAEIDGDDLWIYYRNTGNSSVQLIRYRWKLIAPDGTVVKSEDNYVSIHSENKAPDALDAGERGEAHIKIESDPRAVTLDLSLSHY